MQLFCMHKTTRASQKILETVSILLDLETKLVSAVAPVTLTAVTDRKFKKKKNPEEGILTRILYPCLGTVGYMVTYATCSLYG